MQKSYNKMRYLYKKGLFPFYLEFLSSNIIYIIFNSIISVYAVDILVFFSGICGVNSMPLNLFFAYEIIFPVCVVSAISIIYSICFAIIWTRVISKMHSIASNSNKTNLDKMFKNRFFLYKLLSTLSGVAFYFLAGLVSSILIFNFSECSKYIYSKSIFIFSIIFASVLYGFLFNLSTFYRAGRINWNKLYPQISCNRLYIYNNTLKQYAVTGFLIILSICISCLSIYFYIKNEPDKLNPDSIAYFSMIFASYFTIITFYMRYNYKNVKSNKDSIAYPQIEWLISKSFLCSPLC